jgi:uncharacterized protein YxeA
MKKVLIIILLLIIILITGSFIPYTTKQIRGFCADLNNCTITIKGNFWEQRAQKAQLAKNMINE